MARWQKRPSSCGQPRCASSGSSQGSRAQSRVSSRCALEGVARASSCAVGASCPGSSASASECAPAPATASPGNSSPQWRTRISRPSASGSSGHRSSAAQRPSAAPPSPACAPLPAASSTASAHMRSSQSTSGPPCAPSPQLTAMPVARALCGAQEGGRKAGSRKARWSSVNVARRRACCAAGCCSAGPRVRTASGCTKPARIASASTRDAGSTDRSGPHTSSCRLPSGTTSPVCAVGTGSPAHSARAAAFTGGMLAAAEPLRWVDAVWWPRCEPVSVLIASRTEETMSWNSVPAMLMSACHGISLRPVRRPASSAASSPSPPPSCCGCSGAGAADSACAASGAECCGCEGKQSPRQYCSSSVASSGDISTAAPAAPLPLPPLLLPDFMTDLTSGRTLAGVMSEVPFTPAAPISSLISYGTANSGSCCMIQR
mmetsp:Transcript_16115/g.40409  ORF Transcript_16115/g.40409 Transcript_16115/m.40409 type:complete len:432 (+) Transcript_16115:2263-3558(+)